VVMVSMEPQGRDRGTAVRAREGIEHTGLGRPRTAWDSSSHGVLVSPCGAVEGSKDHGIRGSIRAREPTREPAGRLSGLNEVIETHESL